MLATINIEIILSLMCTIIYVGIFLAVILFVWCLLLSTKQELLNWLAYAFGIKRYMRWKL